MYDELAVVFKCGGKDWYSPLSEQKLEYKDNKITMYYYGTLHLANQTIDLDEVKELRINTIDEDDFKEIIRSKVIYNESINEIEEFDNLHNDTYGILKVHNTI